jgi:ABC-2 type transport system ATP-binding protein
MKNTSLSSSDLAITTKSLTKRFGSKIAVDQIDFEVNKGEVFGFLGPNGAGKSTTIKMLTTLIPPSSGSASILGFDLHSNPKKIREKIGVVQQQDSFDQGLKVDTSLNVYGLLWDTPAEERKKRIDELVARFGMEEFRKKPTVDLSAGQRRRLQVAREFMHDMDLLFLDEPTVGLDPIARRSVLNFFKEKVKEGLTIFFTTHILEEAEYLCQRIAIINNGKIIQIDSPQNLKRHFGGAKAVEFTLIEGTSEQLASTLASSKYVSKISQEYSGAYKISSSQPEFVIPEVYRLADKLGLHVSSIYISETTLEDAFVNLVSDPQQKE